MHILITGGLGFIGCRLARRLGEAGHRVTIVDLARLRPPDPRSLGAEALVAGDVLDVEQWADRLHDVDVLVHAAGIHQVDEVARNPVRHVEVNVTGTLRLLTAAVESDVSRVLYLSSAKVYGHTKEASSESDLVTPADSYALGKVVAEHYCSRFAEDHGLETCAVRPFSVYGPGQDTHTGYIGALLNSLQRGHRVVLPGHPAVVRDFVHVDTVVDVCQAVIEQAGPPPMVLNAGTGRATTLASLVSSFESAIERPLDVTYREPRPGTLEYTLADTTAMSTFTSPDRIDFAEALRTTVRDYAAGP